MSFLISLCWSFWYISVVQQWILVNKAELLTPTFLIPYLTNLTIFTINFVFIYFKRHLNVTVYIFPVCLLLQLSLYMYKLFS